MYSNKLIFGKDQTERIVSIEHKDSEMVIFIQKPSGQISQKIVPATFWFITDKKISSKQELLSGDQFYKHIGKFPSQEQRDEVIKILKKNNIDFYRIYSAKEQSLIYNGMTYYKGLQPKEVSILSFDIETTGLNHDKSSKVLIISNTFRDHTGKLTRKLFNYDEFGSEGEMIDKWCDWVRKIDPSIMCGHNIMGYDWGYLNYLARQNGTKLKLGRDGSEIVFDQWESKFRKDGSQDLEYINCHVYGREIVDTMFLAYKYDIGRVFPSYGLKPIINHLGLEKKNRTFIDAGQIRNTYKNPEMWKLIKQYAEEDADDSLTLFDLMAPSYFYVTQNVSKSFQAIVNSATGSQINNVMVRSYLQDGHSVAKTDSINPIKGGISFAVPGVYKNLYKLDIKSCYPSQILRFKLYDHKKDPNGNFYEMVKYFTYQRFEYKKKYKETGDQSFKDLDGAAKVFINSAYGACTTPGLNYNCEAVGAKITQESRNVIDLALKWSSGYDSKYWFKIFYEKTGHKDA